MDLHFTDAHATDEERAALDTVEGVAIGRRDLVLPALHAVHDALGWISAGAINEIARRLHVAPAEVHGVATFYGNFTFSPAPRRTVRGCEDPACPPDGPVTLPVAAAGKRCVTTACLGLCERAPATLVTIGGVAAEPPVPVRGAVPQAGSPSLVLLRRVGVVDPTSLDDYRARGGYA